MPKSHVKVFSVFISKQLASVYLSWLLKPSFPFVFSLSVSPLSTYLCLSLLAKPIVFLYLQTQRLASVNLSLFASEAS